ncbi:MAG: ATP-binding protein [Oscillospiraceae bacterium]
MNEILNLKYTVNSFDLTSPMEISADVSQSLMKLNINSETIRRCTLALYEGEINMTLHANGGIVTVTVDEDKTITVILEDNGHGIENVEEAMKNGYTTIPKDSPVHQKGFGAGQGLSNMAKYSNTMDIKSVIGLGTTVTMTFK